MVQYPYHQNQDIPSPNSKAKVKWRNIAILLVILCLLILLPSIFLIISALINGLTALTADLIHDFQQVFHTRPHTYSNDTEAFRLAKLCAILIFIAGIIKLLMTRR